MTVWAAETATATGMVMTARMMVDPIVDNHWLEEKGEGGVGVPMQLVAEEVPTQSQSALPPELPKRQKKKVGLHVML